MGWFLALIHVVLAAALLPALVALALTIPGEFREAWWKGGFVAVILVLIAAALINYGQLLLEQYRNPAIAVGEMMDANLRLRRAIALLREKHSAWEADGFQNTYFHLASAVEEVVEASKAMIEKPTSEPRST